ncbi:lipoprotein [Streptomyces glaucescens]|uniref:Putative lipoprotein n=1 Tax=Streptomyces glaucescens TaxID=1907 RepID=A0A089X5N9_STRGA|nr:lipoprotein [Streptomyces glaucescens]AIR98473.1 Putative lipoprotein [Streptomyces glaucescens]
MNVRHTAAWVGVTAVALLATTACGSEKAVDSADQIMSALTRVTDRTQELGSAEIETTTTLDATGGEPISMDGTYSWGDGAAMDVEMDTAAAQMSALQDDPTTRVIMVDGAYYYDVDPQPSGPIAGKEWMRIDVAAVTGEAGADNMAANADPTAALRYMTASTEVEDLGEETVLGKETTHYRGSVGAEHIEKSKLTEAEKKAAITALRASGGKLTCDLWVDREDLPVRISQTGAGMTVTMDFLKFGATEKITAPPAAETGDLTEQVREQRDAAIGQ